MDKDSFGSVGLNFKEAFSYGKYSMSVASSDSFLNNCNGVSKCGYNQ